MKYILRFVGRAGGDCMGALGAVGGWAFRAGFWPLIRAMSGIRVAGGCGSCLQLEVAGGWY